MKKYLISEEGNFYKANLHCHTTISDGKKTPEEIKELYKSLGYSIVCYTDHDVLICHDDLNDDSFLALHGFEAELTANTNKRETCHLCFIGINKENIIQPCWHRTNYLFANAPKYKDQVKFDETKEDFVRSHDPETINKMIKEARKCGFFVTYNHPTWSLEGYNDYINLEGMHAMEMFNGGCIIEGYEEYNPRVYNDLLNTNHKIYCIGTDDNHNWNKDNTRYSDSGIAFTMIKAKSLKYEDITKALLDGNFYSSEKPEIYELFVDINEDKINVTIKCSKADSIKLIQDVRPNRVIYDEDGNGISEATFEISNNCTWFRLVVMDKYGKHACTNAYFKNDLI